MSIAPAYLIIPEADEPYLMGLPNSEVAKMYKVAEGLVGVRSQQESEGRQW